MDYFFPSINTLCATLRRSTLGQYLSSLSSSPPLDYADMLRLYSLILPPEGEGYRADAIQRGIDRRTGKPWLHYSNFFVTNKELVRSLSHHGLIGNVYHSTATFRDLATNLDPNAKDKNWGARKNVHSRQCVHSDLDCGQGKAYPHFAAGKAALLAACKTLNLRYVSVAGRLILASGLDSLTH